MKINSTSSHVLMHGWCCSYGGFFAEPAAATAGSGPPEDEEEYARRIWQEMEKRRRQQSGSAASAARTYFAAETKAKSAREQAAFDAAQRSRQILEEEKAKDRAWREAVSKVLPTVCVCAMMLGRGNMRWHCSPVNVVFVNSSLPIEYTIASPPAVNVYLQLVG